MYLLLTDETNLPNDPGANFFAYGGLIVPLDRLQQLHEGIAATRARAGYGPTDELKFETNARPAHVAIPAARDAKAAVIDLCIEIGCKFIVYVVLHAIARNQQREVLIRWGADHVIGKFNNFLRDSNAFGIVAEDRLPTAAEYQHLRDKFSVGLTYPENNQHVPLDRILMFSSTCMNATHAASAMDIVLGAFRYCINQPRNVAAARAMMRKVASLIWCNIEGEHIYAMEMGLIFRPVEVRVEAFRQEYTGLLQHINALIAEENAARPAAG